MHLFKGFVYDDIDIHYLLHSMKDREEQKIKKKKRIWLLRLCSNHHIIGFTIGQLTLQPILFEIKQ